MNPFWDFATNPTWYWGNVFFDPWKILPQYINPAWLAVFKIIQTTGNSEHIFLSHVKLPIKVYLHIVITIYVQGYTQKILEYIMSIVGISFKAHLRDYHALNLLKFIYLIDGTVKIYSKIFYWRGTLSMKKFELITLSLKKQKIINYVPRQKNILL